MSAPFAAAPHVIVFPVAKVRGYPAKDETKPPRLFKRVTLAEALTTAWRTDAHAVAYDAAEPYRINKELLDNADAAARMAVTIGSLWFDLDDPVAHADGRPARPEWRAEIAPRLAALADAHPAPFIYTSNGGTRPLYTLAPRPIRTPADAEAWRLYYFRCALYVSRCFGLVPDPACADFGRSYRLPHVLRGGKRQKPTVIGDANAIGKWTYEPTDADLGADLMEARRLATKDERWGPVVELLGPPAEGRAKEVKVGDDAGERWGKGQRRSRLRSYGGGLRRNGLSGDALLDALRKKNLVRCEPPLDDVEITKLAEWLDGLPVESKAREPRFADQVIRIVLEKAELFHDPGETAYAIVTVKDVRRVLGLKSRKMRSWIARTVRESLGRSVSANAVDEALVVLDGIAICDRDECKVHLRVAEHGGAIYVDIGDETGASVEITPQGWRVIDAPPVLFRQPSAMRALPRPVPGGRLDDLRPFVNAKDDALHLLLGWLVSAFRPGRPFTILEVHGPQGSAKSTASRLARGLTDPNKAPIRSIPRSEDDLTVASMHSHVVCFDNVSGLQPWVADALCRLATGGGLSKRTLYTDDDETVLESIRPVIVNGIDELANRPDLAERCLVLTLEHIPPEKRRAERQFWADFEVAAPRILGYLLDGVASALRRLSSVQIAELPRMADFAEWIAAAEPGLGLEEGTLLAAYARNRAQVVETALDASPVATAVFILLREHAGRWHGTPSACLEALTLRVPEAQSRAPEWPRGPRALRSALQRASTFLRTAGVTMDLDQHEGHAHLRVWTLKKSDPEASAQPPPAAEANENHADGPVRDRPHNRPPPNPGKTGGADGADGADGPAGSFDAARKSSGGSPVARAAWGGETPEIREPPPQPPAPSARSGPPDPFEISRTVARTVRGRSAEKSGAATADVTADGTWPSPVSAGGPDVSAGTSRSETFADWLDRQDDL